MSERKRDALRRSKFGFVFQSVALCFKMSAYENIDLVRISNTTEGKKRRVEECLDFVGLKKE